MVEQQRLAHFRHIPINFSHRSSLFSCYHCLKSNDAYSHFHPALWQLDDNYHRAAIFYFVQALGLSSRDCKSRTYKSIVNILCKFYTSSIE